MPPESFLGQATGTPSSKYVACRSMHSRTMCAHVDGKNRMLWYLPVSTRRGVVAARGAR